MTVQVAVFVLSSVVAVMVAVPPADPGFTTPRCDTLATSGFDDFHVYDAASVLQYVRGQPPFTMPTVSSSEFPVDNGYGLLSAWFRLNQL